MKYQDFKVHVYSEIFLNSIKCHSIHGPFVVRVQKAVMLSGQMQRVDCSLLIPLLYFLTSRLWVSLLPSKCDS